MYFIQIADSILDFIYPFFSKFIDKKTFRYGVSGACNLVLGWICYFIIYNFILGKQDFYISWISYTFSSETLTVWIVFLINLLVGFILMKYVVFTESELRGRIQLFRYTMTSIISVIINTILMKLFVDVFEWYPTPSFVISTVFIVLFSYIMQNKFSFK